jgi:iron(III) transport system substrate-binding protein
MRLRYPLLATALLVLAAASAFGLASFPSASAQGGELNLYNGRHYDTDGQLYERFTAQTGIKVNVIDGDADQLIERIKAEGANSPADLLITVDAGRLWRAESAGLFQPTQSSVLQAAIPAHLRSPEGTWFGLAKRARVIAYARERVDPAELSTYEALADPQWRGRIVVRSSSHVYNQSLIGSLIEANGLDATEAWAGGIAANLARPPQGGDSDQLKAVAAGQADLAITNTYYLARLATSNSPEDQAVFNQLGVFFPNQESGGRGTHVNVSGGGVIKTAPNPASAVAFLEFLTSPEAQLYFAQVSKEYPVVEGVEVDPVLASFGGFTEDRLNAATFGANNQLALLVANRAGWR